MADTFEEKRAFLLANPDFLIMGASRFYPFKLSELRRYEPILDWNQVSLNENIPWSTDIIDAFIGRFFDKSYLHDEASYNLPYTSLEENPALPWNTPFVHRYRDLWHWDTIASAQLLPLDTLYHFLDLLIWEVSHERRDYGAPAEQWSRPNHWMPLERMPPADVSDFVRQWEQNPQAIDPTKENWGVLSESAGLPWSTELLDAFAEHWDWNFVTSNPAVPWNREWLVRYLDHLCAVDGGLRSCMWGMATNPHLEWDKPLMRQYAEYQMGSELLKNPNVVWDMEALKIFYGLRSMFEYDAPEHLWENLFSEFMNERVMGEMLEGVMLIDLSA